MTSDLVQADVIVLDRQGRFVDNLQQEQMELRVDEAPQAIAVFERVQTGAAKADAQRGGERGQTPRLSAAEAVTPPGRGRTVLFFVR